MNSIQYKNDQRFSGTSEWVPVYIYIYVCEDGVDRWADGWMDGWMDGWGDYAYLAEHYRHIWYS